MVLILNGSSEHFAHVWRKKNLKKKLGFDDSFDVIKCLKQIEIPDLIHMCEFWVPSNINTIGCDDTTPSNLNNYP